MMILYGDPPPSSEEWRVVNRVSYKCHIPLGHCHWKGINPESCWTSKSRHCPNIHQARCYGQKRHRSTTFWSDIANTTISTSTQRTQIIHTVISAPLNDLLTTLEWLKSGDHQLGCIRSHQKKGMKLPTLNWCTILAIKKLYQSKRPEKGPI